MPEQEYDTSLPVEEASAPAEPAVTPEVPAVEAPAEQAPDAEPEVGVPTPTFTVTVDGETFEISTEEAIAGYQRQADYTRKTQGLAQERQTLESEREQAVRAQQLWDAIEKNPQHTIAAIADAYGYKLTPAQEAAAEAQRGAQADPFEDLYEEAKPQGATPDPRLDRIEQFMQAQIERDQTAAVEAELRSVRDRYSVKLADPTQFNQQLIEYAIENDIGSLDAAFRAMSFEAAQQAAARKRIAGRKQELPPVAGGHPVQAGVLVPGAGSALPSFEEAFAAAQAELDA